MTEELDFEGQDEMGQDIVLSIAVSPAFAEDGLCFAARHAGLFRSADGGRTFKPAYDSLKLQTELPTLAVAVSPQFTADHSVFAGAEGGILRSFDGGETWLAELFPAPPPVVSALLISPAFEEDGTLFAATLEDGVFRSADRGAHWELWNFRLLDLHVLSMAISPNFKQDETLFAGTETGLFRSTNGGRAWRELDFAADAAPVLGLAISPDYAQDGTVYAGTEAAGLWRSRDRGASWERLAAAVIGDSSGGEHQGPVNAVLATKANHLLVLLEDAVLISRDAGVTWSVCDAGEALEQGASCVAAPLGLAPGAPLLVGLGDGSVTRLAAPCCG
jgi:photosystem II stability/assembly factor-like uncharacterized protein